MSRIYIVFSCVLSCVCLSFAQARMDWIHQYRELDNFQDWIMDVYHTTDGGWACTGMSFSQRNASDCWLLKTDAGGEIEFSESYVINDGQSQQEIGFSLIQTDVGGYLLGGFGTGQRHDVMAILTDEVGQEIWTNLYGGGNYDQCKAVIECKNGSFLLAGFTYSFGAGSADGWLINIDNNGDVIWDSVIGTEAFEEFKAVREVDGGFMVAGRRRPENGFYSYWLVRTNELGEMQWEQTYGLENNNEELEDMTSCRNGGFILAGIASDSSKPYLVRVNAQGNVLWESYYQDQNDVSFDTNVGSVAQLADNGFVFGGRCSAITALLRIDSGGNYEWYHVDNYGADGASIIYSVNCDDDGGIIAGGYFNKREHHDDGFLLKLFPDRTPPYFDSYSPDSLNLTVLLNDTINFFVDARDRQEDSILFVWTLDEDTVSTDTSWSYVCEELGEWDVSCSVSDEDPGEIVTWHLESSDFFINSASPGCLDMIVQRGTIDTFTIGVSCIEPEDINVHWSVVNRDHERIYLGEMDTVEVNFDLAGEWAVEADAVWHDEGEALRWNVNVRSAIWWWLPHEDTVDVVENEIQRFTVFPFNPDSDTLVVAWWLDGDSLHCNDEILSLDFFEINELGEHNLTVIVRDGAELDTVEWQINVVEFNNVLQDRELPTDFALTSVYPNPFNSTTTIGYSLPVAGNVSLTVYDLRGREVTRLVDGAQPAGTHEVVWTADGVSSGVYVVKMTTGEKTAMSKVVLVK